MELTISQAMLDALMRVGHVPDDVKRRVDAIVPEPGASPPSYWLTLSDDEAMELSELLQWHVRTDAATGHPTPDTAPYAEMIRAITEQQF